MSARASMAAIIAQVRLLLDDSNNAAYVFTDDTYQEALDHTREDVNYLELAPKQTIQSGGGVVWLDYYAMVGSVGVGDWEDDVVLQGYPSFTVLTPATSDPIVGHWTFGSTQRPPVFIVGKNYDRYAAAADLCRRWAAKVKLKAIDNRTADQSQKLSQQLGGIIDLSREYDRKARPRMLQMVRNDVPSGSLWQRGKFDNSRTSF